MFESDNGLNPEMNICPIENNKNEMGNLLEISLEDITKKLKTLDENKAVGVDKVSHAVLKNSADAFAVPLKLIFEKSLKNGEVPEEWREANVSPIYKKKGCKLDPSNYRPVSLTSTICKILESFIRDHIMKFLQIN